MASPARSGRLARVAAICLMLLTIHTLPLLAAEKVEHVAETTVAASVAPEEKPSLVKKLVGIASYYAKKFHGRRTTSGEKYQPELMTAAHHSLPLGTKVLVRNLANDKEVTVVVNDRCAKKSIPFIDLSRAAARKLGFLGAGKAKVAIIPLTDGES
jgi:rare lipoprotein A